MQVVINNNDNRNYDAYLADVFSCGVILWKLLFGYGEWPNSNAEHERKLHQEGETDLFIRFNRDKMTQGLRLNSSRSRPVRINLGSSYDSDCTSPAYSFFSSSKFNVITHQLQI